MRDVINGISSLSLINFRCYQNLRLLNLTQNVVLYGQNGAGKTSILEALSLLSATKGLRKAPNSEIRRKNSGQAQWGVSAILNSHNEQTRVGIGGIPSNGEQKIAKINGDLVNISDIEKHIWLLWITPQTDRLFTEQMQIRRKFFDHLIKGINPKYHNLILQYKKLTSERLKGLQRQPIDETWLKIVEGKIAGISIEIIKYRLAYCKALNELSEKCNTSFPKTHIANKEDVLADDINDYEELLLSELKKHREKDKFTGNTNVGVHRCNWRVSFDGQRSNAENYSTGEQRVLLITLILLTARIYVAHRVGTPVLLFDDTTAHLDETNTNLFYEEITEIGIQTWSSGVFRPKISEILKPEFCFININSGVCTQE